MTTDDFLSRVAAQPVITIEHSVSIAGPQLKARLAENKPILMSEWMAHPDQRFELRTFRYANMVGQGIGTNEIEMWQARHPDHPLPRDLRELLMRVNGVHLWADLDKARAYFGILPLAEWEDTKASRWARMFESPPAGNVTISYHDNGDDFLVLDTQACEYLWYDLQDFYHPKHVGRTVGELLDFWWAETAWLDPSKQRPDLLNSSHKPAPAPRA
jgi:hypothetical protein